MSPRVLLVDNEPCGALLRVLKREFVHVEVADSGIEALVQCERTPFAVVVLELAMPNMDGFQTAAELRRQGYRRKIVTFSGMPTAAARQSALDSGADAHIEKPDVASLVAQLHAFARDVARSEPDPVPPHATRVTETADDLVRVAVGRHGLSVMQAAVLRARLDGLGNKETGDRLGCTKSTVGQHWFRIFTKSGIRSKDRFIASLLENSHR